MEPVRATYPPPQTTLISNGSRPNSNNYETNTYQYQTMNKSDQLGRPTSNNYAIQSRGTLFTSQDQSWRQSRVSDKQGETKQKSRVKYSFKKTTQRGDRNETRVEGFVAVPQETRVIREMRAEPVRQQSGTALQFRSTEQRSRTYEVPREERREVVRRDNIQRQEFRKIQTSNEQVRYEPSRVDTQLPRQQRTYQPYQPSRVQAEISREKKVERPLRVEGEAPRAYQPYQPKVDIGVSREQKVQKPLRVEAERPRQQRDQRPYQPRVEAEVSRQKRIQKPIRVEQVPRQQRIIQPSQPRIQAEISRDKKVYQSSEIKVDGAREQKVFIPSRVEAEMPRQEKKYQPFRDIQDVQKQSKIYESKVEYQAPRQQPKVYQPVVQIPRQQQKIYQPSRIQGDIQRDQRPYQPRVEDEIQRASSFYQPPRVESGLPEPRGEKEYLRLRQRVKDLESQLIRIRFIAKNRKQRCEEQSKPLDLQCINALVQIYNITVSGTQQRPLSFAQNKMNKFASVPQIRRDNVPQPVSEGFSFPITANQISTQIQETKSTFQYKPFDSNLPQISSEKPFVSTEQQFVINEKTVVSNQNTYIAQEKTFVQEKSFIPEEKSFVRSQKPSQKPLDIVEKSIAAYQRQNYSSESYEKPSSSYQPIAPYEKTNTYSEKSYSFDQNYLADEKLQQNKSKVPLPPPQVPSNFRMSNDLPQINEQSQLYLKQIRELRMKIQQLETEKSKIVEKNKYLELSELTIKDYREEIERNRVDIEIAMKKESQYETQLLASQNKIIYLEGLVNNRPSSSPPEESSSPATQKKSEQEIMDLQDKVNTLSEELEAEKAKTAEAISYLERAEDYIMQLQRQQYKQKEQGQSAQPSESIQQVQPVQPVQEASSNTNERVVQLEQALDQEYRNQQSLREQYDQQIRNITFELTQQINQYEVKINQYNTTINNYQQQFNVFQTQINQFTTTIQNFEQRNTYDQNQPQIIQKPVEKIVYQEKIVQKPVQKIVYQEKTVEKIVQKPVQKIVYQEKIVQKPVEKIVYQEKIVEKIVQKPVSERVMQKIVEKPVQKIVYQDRIVEKPVEKIVYQQKIVEKPVEKIVYKQKIVQKPVQRTVQKQTARSGGIEQDKINQVVQENGKKTLQIIFLMQQINRLNLQFNQLRDHLGRAQNHIRQTHQYVTELELQVKTSKFEASDTNTHKLKVKDLQGKIALLTQENTRYQQRQAQHKEEVLKFQGIITEIDTRCISIQQERDSLLTQSSSSPALKELEVKYEQQSQELTELMNHLGNAEEYIRQNGQLWQKAGQAYQVLPEKLAIIEMLKKDLQMTRAQNKELGERIVQLQKLIEMMENRKPGTAPADFKTQQTQKSLSNYIKLYNESQTKLSEAAREIDSLKLSATKVTTTQVTSRRTEEPSSERARLQEEYKSLETQNTQIKNHLIGAQTYIKQLEEQLANLAQQFSVIEKEHHMHKSQNQNIHASLQRAEKQMAEMQRLIPKNTPTSRQSPSRKQWKP